MLAHVRTFGVDAAITRGSADALALKKGNRVTVVVKSTDVMIAK